ncbi:hypothetical protein PF005_g7227 [Phytophthora fragariae]|uniref:Uncharacterized protein n=1 Tax=Phytophthora fragariae TaxID=53985 RepID=A0A6A3YP71_9STRA|nr:hypothetical protein PF003_g39766 [Phytophthora fragariae]KAE9221103.1 hypothetical protein PF005_g7227 [Phytophthora fragariae]KAE9250608.1 hypothetical protein PF002_g4681 [Phytophthora fragariae]KAE9318679.1 hypothetical protein PF001_g6251 [Phytophthora fragariae]
MLATCAERPVQHWKVNGVVDSSRGGKSDRGPHEVARRFPTTRAQLLKLSIEFDDGRQQQQEVLHDKLGGPDGAGRLLTGLDEHYSVPFFTVVNSAYTNSKHVVTAFEIAETQRDVPAARLNRALAGIDQREFYFANILTMTNDGQHSGACHTDTKTRDALLKWMRFRDCIRV